MSVRYRPVQWTRFKLIYDALALAAVGAYVLLYQGLSRALFRGANALSEPILAMRAWGSCAFVLLTLVLCIGPLARLETRCLPLLYNRRHLGVALCGVALMHASNVLGYYFAWGKSDQWTALLRYDGTFTSASVPFVRFGIAALIVLLVLAATSHDFWQRLFGPAGWKALHMSVYLAYACVLVHVAFGPLQREPHTAFVMLVCGSAALVLSLHVLAARRSAEPAQDLKSEGPWLDAGPAERLRCNHARAFTPPHGERIAIVNRDGRLFAVDGSCAHQGGPLGEGRVIDGCLTCPWHGWQYRPEDGRSPPPFEEVLRTYRLRVKDGRILVDPRPLPPGTTSMGGADG